MRFFVSGSEHKDPWRRFGSAPSAARSPRMIPGRIGVPPEAGAAGTRVPATVVQCKRLSGIATKVKAAILGEKNDMHLKE